MAVAAVQPVRVARVVPEERLARAVQAEPVEQLVTVDQPAMVEALATVALVVSGVQVGLLEPVAAQGLGGQLERAGPEPQAALAVKAVWAARPETVEQAVSVATLSLVAARAGARALVLAALAVAQPVACCPSFRVSPTSWGFLG